MRSRLQFSLRTALIAVFVLALAAWPTGSWLRNYLANRGHVSVKGRVTFKGQPLLAKVIFTPTAGGVPSQGVTKADGTYELERLVRPGEYTVAIAEVGAAKRGVPRKYADGFGSGLRVHASDSGPNNFHFELSD